jgi:uncharacterized protein involved in type VI secretion and phage assembly
MRKPAKGLCFAIVVSIVDPLQKNRILIQIPDIHSETIWAEVARLDAGDFRGTIFFPEIGDKVVVGFMNGDINFPIVLGMLFKETDQSPINSTESNPEKGIFTRGRMRIHFDDQNKTIIIDTPAGNSIQLNEASQELNILDQNNNKIIMSSSGIEIQSAKNISVTAGGTISLKSTSGTYVEGKLVS